MERPKTEAAAEWLLHTQTQQALENARNAADQWLVQLKGAARNSTDPRVVAAVTTLDRYEEFYRYLGGK